MKNTTKILVAAGAGLAIGAVLGVLFAPDKGTETRHKLAEEAKKLKDELVRKMKEGKEKIKEEFDKANGKVDEMMS